jgi:hypothetical protein
LLSGKQSLRCDHRALCPSFGGTPPPFPDAVPGPDDLLPYQRRAVQDVTPSVS